MEWAKIASVILIILVLFCGISIAGYTTTFPNVVKIDFSQKPSFYFLNNLKYFKPDRICGLENKSPAPISNQIEEIGRLENTVKRCI
jgi:hypothetical protein